MYGRKGYIVIHIMCRMSVMPARCVPLPLLLNIQLLHVYRCREQSNRRTGRTTCLSAIILYFQCYFSRLACDPGVFMQQLERSQTLHVTVQYVYHSRMPIYSTTVYIVYRMCHCTIFKANVSGDEVLFSDTMQSIISASSEESQKLAS